jgi:two-component system sensor histidine kinase DesK
VIYGAIFLAWAFRNTRQALMTLGAIVLALGIDGYFFHAPLGFLGPAVVVSIGVGVSNIFFAERAQAMDKLRMADEEIAHLAKVAERERIARDLHDVLGHTLSLIIVKSTLAGKLLDQSADHGAITFDAQRAKNEVADIEKVSREAMAEIRSTLRGYRTYKLDDEIKRAASTLRSAGVNAESETAEIAMSPAQESVVALIVREAVTNVVRHAQASTCRVRLATNNGHCVLEVEDNGRGGAMIEGNGLRGMRERIEALGGTVTRETNQGTKLHFEFPLATSSNGNS